ncbi:tetratricopeptide repeat protein [Chromobacterium haemolyticum]|uniref:tetratricopeptide repeat protein n=1 Tax=Chromobacterium haemolyticum TaxID=394935 RepID=UPI002955C1C1|nr:tetratricopeptide repeat protein [Chromobacterium haemolyticum]WON85019.1 sel1 repeat family protein [Chromobacterium haemolyticum]
MKSNRHEAEHHFQRAAAIWRNFADVGDSNADFALAYLYLIGRGVPKDLNIAKAYLEKANEIIGSKYLYLKGLIEIASGNEQIGNRYILDAANAGDKFAQNELGIWYEVGKMGGALDSSLKWYTSAADKGLAPAALNLMCLQAIKGLRFRVQDVRMLAEQGEPHAMYDLGTFYHKGEGVGIDYSMAIRWYRRAALHGEPRAKYILGLIESK